MTTTARRPVPWTAVVGLALLWLALVAVAAFSVLFSLWSAATAAPSPLDIVLGVLPLLVAVAILVCATLRVRWARWVAVVLGVVLGALALVVLLATLSPAFETVAISLAAIAGGTLLALPSSGAWFGPASRPVSTA